MKWEWVGGGGLALRQMIIIYSKMAFLLLEFGFFF